MIIADPRGDIFVRLNMIGFVDDSTSITSGDGEDTVKSLLEKVKHDAQLWHDLLWCSGGKLELSKCGYHLIYYDYHDSGIPYMIHSPNTDIELKNDKDEIVKVSAKNIYQARKNLGHYKAPAGEYTTQIEAIKKKATNI